MWPRNEDEKILLCVSVPYTGTTLLIEILRDNPSIVTFNSLHWIQRTIQSTGKPGVNLIHAHFTEDQLRSIKEIAKISPIIVPLRDPLLAILSNRERETNFNIVECFLLLVETLSNHKPIYVPVDFLEDLSKQERTSQFIKLVAPLNLDYLVCSTWAEKWPRLNEQEYYAAQAHYYLKLKKKIKNLIPEEWEALIAARPVLKPFLQKQGCTS